MPYNSYIFNPNSYERYILVQRIYYNKSLNYHMTKKLLNNL